MNEQQRASMTEIEKKYFDGSVPPLEEIEKSIAHIDPKTCCRRPGQKCRECPVVDLARLQKYLNRRRQADAQMTSPT